MYTKSQEEIQKIFGEEKLADIAQKHNIRSFIKEVQRNIINQSTWFVLATVDELGCPNVSIKAGPSGFVTATETEVIFEIVSGNGMNITRGDIYHSQITNDSNLNNLSLLFICPTTGRKVRLKGKAKIILNNLDIGQATIHLRVNYVWENCPRFNCFISRDVSHKNDSDHANKYLPSWKRLDIVNSSLNERERQVVGELGTITPDEWDHMIKKGDGDSEYEY
jgi:predicted pyridoxine 5'-phosphate oxidase superfamily flavin-nucleotide-binding protein